jgi:hypothetical protein
VTGRWFSPVSSTNKTDRHDIAEILLKVALNTINQTKPSLTTMPLNQISDMPQTLASDKLIGQVMVT